MHDNVMAKGALFPCTSQDLHKMQSLLMHFTHASFLCGTDIGGAVSGTVEEIAAEASASEALGAELSAHATAVEAEKWGLDATTVYPKADDGAVLDVLIQPADQATHASIPCGRISHENMEDPMDDDTIPRTEWLLLLRHCAECHPPDEEWNFARSRAVVLHLWKHILRCSDARCKYPR